MPNKPIQTLAINSNGVVFAGTWGSGVFRSTQGTTSVEENSVAIQTNCELLNFPNPIKKPTTIRFSVTNPGHIVLKIFNLLGTEVALLIDEELNIEDLPSGVYFCHLRNGNSTFKKRMEIFK